MGALKSASLATGRREVYYPESDGKPMAETDLHRDEMFDLIARLQTRYADAPDVYVSGNLLLYYKEGDPRAAVAPDVFVVQGVPKGQRRIYKLWLEGVPPAVVIEVTSRKTKGEDRRTKRALYARLGVAEYFMYDPEAEYLSPPLQGHRLVAGTYQPLDPDEVGTLRSKRLRLDLRLEAGRLELYDGSTGARLPRLAEQAKAERQRAEHERRRAEEERQRAESAHRRAEEEQRRAEEAQQRADEERQRAESERQRADAAEAELARLRDLLRRE